MAKKPTLEQEIGVVKSLLEGTKMSLDEIKKKHPHLKAAVKAVGEGRVSVKKKTKPTGSGCCAEEEAVGSQFV